MKKLMLEESISKQQHRTSMARTSASANDKNNFDLVSIKKSSLNDLLLETGVYISATKTQSVDRCENNENNGQMFTIGDRILSINGISLTNKNLYEVMELVNQCKSFNLVIQKVTSQVLNHNGVMCNSASSILTEYLLDPRILQNPRKAEHFMISQTLSNTSSSPSQNHNQFPNNNKTSKPQKSQKFQIANSDTTNSTSSHIQTPHRPRHQNQQLQEVQQSVHNKDSDMRLLTAEALYMHQQNQLRIANNNPHAKENNAECDSRYQDLIKAFHTTNRKEMPIQMSPRIQRRSQTSLAKHISSNDLLAERLLVVSPENRSKRVVVSDLMSLNAGVSIKRNEEKQKVNESMGMAGMGRTSRNNTAL